MKPPRPNLSAAAGCAPIKAGIRTASPKRPQYPALNAAAGCPGVSTRLCTAPTTPQQTAPIILNPRISEDDRITAGRIGITLQQFLALRCRGLIDTPAQVEVARAAVAELRMVGLYSHSSVVDVINAVQFANAKEDPNGR